MAAQVQPTNIFTTKAAKTFDGFRNFIMRLGVSAPGAEGVEGQNQISAGMYQPNLVTRNRIQLEWAYRGSWIVGRVVDCIAEDMTKAGIILNTNEGAERIQEFKVQMSRLQVWQRIKDTTAWGRLYGGAIGVFQIDGQRLDTPLDPETIEQGQFRGIAVYDRWQLNPVLSRIIEEGPDIGLPAYYDIVLGSNLNDPGQVPGQGSQTAQGAAAVVSSSSLPEKNSQSIAPETGQTAGGPMSSRVRVHHTRCFRMGGIKLPFFQAITEMMWDESVIERLWDRLIEFDTATASAGGLIGRAMLRTIGIDGFREILSAGGEAKSGLLEMFSMMSQFQNNENLTLLDKNDTYNTTAYSFAGLSDMLERFEEQVAGAGETPLVRLFGQSPGGLGSNGETDIRNYYDTINNKQEQTLRNPIELLIKVLWRSTFDEPAPKDLTFTFTPLWQMSAKDKADIASENTASVIAAHQEGLVDTPTAMKELKQQSAETGLFTHISDEQIEEAEVEEPPMPDEPVDPEKEGGGTGDPGEGPTEPKEVIRKAGINSIAYLRKKAVDFIRQKAGKWIVYSENGKKLGDYPSKEAAQKRLGQIEYFKHKGDSKLKQTSATKISEDQKAIYDWLAS